MSTVYPKSLFDHSFRMIPDIKNRNLGQLKIG